MPRLLGVRMAIGGALVVLLWQLVGTSDYLGLGVPTIVRAFSDPSLPSYAFAAKLAVHRDHARRGLPRRRGDAAVLRRRRARQRARAGCSGSRSSSAPASGMAAVFAAASNTPLALSIMAVELLGANVLPHVVIVCVIAYLLSGHRSIYPAQRVTEGKHGDGEAAARRIRDVLRPVRPPDDPRTG